MRTGAALALVLVLAACTAGGQFDPTEVVSSDIFNTKKKISASASRSFRKACRARSRASRPIW